jgi:hypothetical protein
MPHISCNPDARCDTGEGEKKSDLESPQKVFAIKGAKEKYAGGKQDPEAGVFPATAPCHLPDIEKADQGEEPNHKKLSPDVPMRQPPKSEKNQSRKENSMFIVLREKVGKSQGAGCHFLKKRGSPVPLIPKWDVDAIPEYETAD